MKNEVQQPSGLISVLMDKTVEFGDRDDAAMDLGSYDGPEVEEALLKVVMDHTEDKDILESVVESVSEIWIRAGREYPGLVEKMHPVARELFERET